MPASILDKSNTSLIRWRRSLPASCMTCAFLCSTASSSLPPSAMSLDKIRIEFNGVRNSWLMLAKNSDLYLLAWVSCWAREFSSLWVTCKRLLRSSTSRFDPSRAWVCCSRSSLAACNSSCCACSSSVIACELERASSRSLCDWAV